MGQGNENYNSFVVIKHRAIVVFSVQLAQIENSFTLKWPNAWMCYKEIKIKL